MNSKLCFFLFGILGVGLTIFLFATRHNSPPHHPEKAFACLERKEYAAAEEALEKSDPATLSFPLALYKGYIAQASGQFRKSDALLQSVLKEPPRKNQKEMLFETFLVHIINAYHEKRDADIRPLLESAHQFSQASTPLLFFDGLSYYLQQHYADALRFWSAYQPPKQNEWLALAIERGFPATWRQLHMAHCLTEEGDIIAGREILEQQQHQLELPTSDYHRLATLFLGLTYLKEAANLPLHERASYYKLAHFYFARAEKLEPFFREKNCIIAHIQHELDSLLADFGNEEARVWSFAFLHTLQDWKAHNALHDICEQVVQTLVQNDPEEGVRFCKAILQEFNGSLFHKLLVEHFHQALAHNIKSGQMEPLFTLWHLAENVVSSSQLMAQDLARLTQEEMCKTIYWDDATLTRTRSYLAFWSHLSQERAYHRMAQELLAQSALFWNHEGQEQKGQLLMALALHLSPNKKGVTREIESFLSKLYSQAENSNMIYRLSLIHDALAYFNVGIKKKDLIDSSKVANHLADAAYLYDARNYAAAKTHAAWVLKLDATNAKALRLLGLASFQLGDYSSALFYLQQLPECDDLTQKALAFSQAFASQQQKEHIAQIDNTDSFTEE